MLFCILQRLVYDISHYDFLNYFLHLKLASHLVFMNHRLLDNHSNVHLT